MTTHDDLHDDYAAFRARHNLPKATTNRAPTFPKVVRALSLSNEAYEGLVALAREHGFIRGAQPNVSQLLEYIGLGLIEMLPPETQQHAP